VHQLVSYHKVDYAQQVGGCPFLALSRHAYRRQNLRVDPRLKVIFDPLSDLLTALNLALELNSFHENAHEALGIVVEELATPKLLRLSRSTPI